MSRAFLLVAALGLSLNACGAADPADESDTAESELVGLAFSDVVTSLAYGNTTTVASAPTRRYRAVRFDGNVGDAATIWVRSSKDARAWLIGPDFKKTLASNDDADSSTKDARISFTLTKKGSHTIAFREKQSAPTSFEISLAAASSPPPVPPVPPGSNATDPCVKHPWAMSGGCRDRQGRSSATGPTSPKIAWQLDLPGGGPVRQLVVDAAGTTFATSGARLTSVAPDGAIRWSVVGGGLLLDMALGGDDAVYVYEQGRRPTLRGDVVVHSFVRFAPSDGARSVLFSEEVGSDRLPRTVTPLADGAVHFGAPAELAEQTSVAGSPATAKVYAPNTKALSDTDSRFSPSRRADLPGGGWVKSDSKYLAPGSGDRDFWVDRYNASGALVSHAAPLQLWGVAPGGTVWAVTPDPLYNWGAFGWPTLLRQNGTSTKVSTLRPQTHPFSVAIGADDAVVFSATDTSKPEQQQNSLSKYAKTGALVFEATVPLEGGPIVLDAAGNIYGGGLAFSASGAPLWTSWSTGSWLPSHDLIALGPNRTLMTTWSRPASTGRLYALRDQAP